MIERRRVIRGALAAALVGLVLCVLGAVLDAPQAYASFLTAYAAGLSVAVGALMLVMIGYLTGARWFVGFRPLALRVAATLPLFALLFLLLIPGLRALYPWVPPLDRLSPELQHDILQKQSYLNVPSFLVRTVIYFGVWIGFSRLLRRAPRAASAAGLPLIALTLTFAAFDWMMSLTPSWFSTIYGVYYFAGGFLGALGLVAVLAYLKEQLGQPAGIAIDAYHALGKLLLTFVLFWAYIAYSQLLIVWIANLPKEITWYVPRLRGSWGILGLVLLLGQFLVPFVLLLFRRITTRRRSLAVIGLWLLVMHYLDVYWLVLPALHPARVQLDWLDFAGLLLVVGLALAYGMWLPPEALLPAAEPVPPEASYAL
jgi:hypothetical protein